MANDGSYPEIGGVSQTGERLDGESSSYDLFDSVRHGTGEERDATSQEGILGYSANLTKREAVEKLKDTRFLQDIYDYYYDKDGTTFSGAEEAIEEFFSDRAWSNLNTVYVLGEAAESFSNDDTQNARLARLQNVYEQMPNFYEEGGRGASGFWQNAAAVLVDPVNLLGFGFGGLGAKAAVKGAVALGKNTTPELIKAGIWGGVKRGAASEFVVGGAVEAAHSAGTQTRDIQLGLQDEFSTSNLAMAAGLGAGAGAILGGTFGALGAVVPFKPDMTALKQGKLKFHDSAWRQGKTEGMLEQQKAQEALKGHLAGDKPTPDAADITQNEIDDVFNRKAAQLELRLKNITEEIDIPTDEVDAALAGGTRIDPDTGKVVNQQTIRELLDEAVAEGRTSQAQADELISAQEALPHHDRMRNALQTIRGYKERADALEAEMATAPKDPANPAAGLHEVTALRQHAAGLQITYNRYLNALFDEDTATMARTSEEFVRATEGVEAAAARVEEAGEVVEYGEVRSKPAEPEGEAVEGEGEADVLDEVDSDVTDVEAEAEAADADIDVETEVAPEPTRAEGLRAEALELDAILKKNENITRSLRKKINSKTATPEAKAEAQKAMDEHVQRNWSDARKQMLRERNELNKAADEAEADFEAEVEDVEAPSVAQQADEILEADAQIKVDEIMDMINPPGQERALSVEEAIIDAAPTEKKTLEFMESMDPESNVASLRKELRLLTKGKMAKYKEEARAQWMTRKMEEMEAREEVFELFTSIVSPEEITTILPYGPRVFHSEFVEAMLQSTWNPQHVVARDAGAANLTSEQTAHKLALATREYEKWLEENAINLFAELADGMGEKFTAGELMEEILKNYGQKTHGILDRQMFIPDADAPTVKSEAWDELIPKHFTEKQRGVLAEAMNLYDTRFPQYNPALKKKFFELTIAKIEAMQEGGFNPLTEAGQHMGKNFEWRFKRMNGKDVMVLRAGKIQKMLQKANKLEYAFFGKLIEDLYINGKKYTGEEGAFTAIQQAVLDNASPRTLVDDPQLFHKKQVRDPVTKKESTVYSGENVEIVLELRKVVAALRKLKEKDSDIASELTKEIRDGLVARGVIPSFRVDESASRGHVIQLGSPEEITQRFPLQISKVNNMPSRQDIPQRKQQIFAYKIARTDGNGAMKQRAGSETMLFGVNLTGPYDLNNPVTTQGRIKRFEKIGGVVYEKQLVSHGTEIQSGRGETTKWSNGDEVFVVNEPETGDARLFLSKEDAPSGWHTGGVDSPQSAINDINLAIRFLTKTSQREADGHRINIRNNSPEIQAARMVSEIKKLQAEANNQPNTAQGNGAKASIQRRVGLLKEKLLKIDPDALTRSKWKKLGEAALREAQNRGLVDDPKQARKDLGDTLGEPLTEEDIQVGDAVADRRVENTAMDRLKKDMSNDAMNRFLQHKDTERLQGDLADIEKRFSEADKVPQETKPKGKAKQSLFHHNGIEVDVANHFEIKGKGIGGRRKRRKIRFLGKIVGSVKRVGEEGAEEFEIYSPNRDTVVVVEHESMINRELLTVFEPEIIAALDRGQLKPSSIGKPGESFESRTPNNSNTYENTPQEPLDVPPDRAAAEEAELDAATTNPIVNTPMTEFSSQIPEGRRFSVQILSGPLTKDGPVFRHVSQKQLDANDPIRKILGKQTKEVFILGHSDPALPRLQRDQSFIEFGKEHMPPQKPQATQNVAPDVEPSAADVSEAGTIQPRFKDDPEIVDPATRPIGFEQARTIKLDQHVMLNMDAAREFDEVILKDVGQAVERLGELELKKWNSPEFGSPQEYQKFMRHMEYLNDVISYHTPHGIRWNNASRNRSMQQFSHIFGKRRQGEINAVMHVLRNIQNSDSALPRFRETSDPNSMHYTPPKHPRGEGYSPPNTIGLSPDSSYNGGKNFIAPDFTHVMHEIGHWAYFNVLSPKDKSKFWEAMQKYIRPEGGIDLEGLTKRLSGTARNELESPAEFFAQQFSQFAISRGKAGTPTELMSLWKRITHVVHKVMERYFLTSDNDFIDPDLIPIFERILPDKDFKINKYSPALDYLTPFGGRPKYLADKLVNWQEIKNNIEAALDSGDPEKMREALGGRSGTEAGAAETNSFVQEAIAYKGKSGDEHYFNRKGQRKKRVRLLDEGPLKKINEKGQPEYQFMNSFFIRNKMLRAMRDIQAFQAANKDDSLTRTMDNERLAEIAGADTWTPEDELQLQQSTSEINRLNEIEDLMESEGALDEAIARGPDDDVVDAGEYDEGFQFIDAEDAPLEGEVAGYREVVKDDPLISMAMQGVGDEAVDQMDELIRMSNATLNVIHEIQVEMGKQVGRNVKKVADEGLTINSEGRLQATYNKQSEFYRRRQKAEVAAEKLMEDRKTKQFMDDVERVWEGAAENRVEIDEAEGPTPRSTGEMDAAEVSELVGQEPLPPAKEIKTIIVKGQATYVGHTKKKGKGKTKEEVPHGEGTLTTLDGDVYTGSWKGGVYSGQGTLNYGGISEGDSISGTFKNGKIWGKGVEVQKDTLRYEGDFVEGAWEGDGTMAYVNGDRYIGKFKDGQPHGIGTESIHNGASYTGQFKNGIREGKGTMTFPSGTKVRGKWVNGSIVKKGSTTIRGRDVPKQETTHGDQDEFQQLQEERLIKDEIVSMEVKEAAYQMGLDPKDMAKMPESMNIGEIAKEMVGVRGPRGTFKQFAGTPTEADPKGAPVDMKKMEADPEGFNRLSARQAALRKELHKKILMTAELELDGDVVNYKEYFDLNWAEDAPRIEYRHPTALLDKPRNPDGTPDWGWETFTRQAHTEVDFQQLIAKAFEASDDRAMRIAAAGLKYFYQTQPIVPSIKSSLISRAINTENIQGRGLSEENGIPPRATAEVKDILRKITHRDKEIEDTARTLTYRMMNLMGKTQQNAISRANIMSLEDIQRLFGVEEDTGSKGFFRHAQDGPEFNQLRKTMRKLGASIKRSHGGGADFIGLRPNVDSRTAANQPYTAIHEMGHLLVRGMFDKEKRQLINSMYKEAILKRTKRALENEKHYTAYSEKGYPNEVVQEYLAEEWFVDGFAEYLANRITKTDVFGNVTMKGRLATMVDEIIESVRYMVSGLLGKKDLRQQFRYLTFGGDMLANRSALNTPVRNAVRSAGMFSMSPEVAPRYARETIENFTPEQEVHAREFAGISETEDIMTYVYYHGTPNGGKFNRGSNPDVILEPSGSDALFGEGIYVTKSDSLAEDYSHAGHFNSLKQIVDGAEISPRARGVALKHAEAIADNRVKISDQLKLMDGIHYRESTIKRAANIKEGTLTDVLDEDPAYQLLRNQKRLSSLYQKEKLLWKLFSKRTGVSRDPKVLPLLVRAEDTFNFDSNTFYSVGSTSNPSVQDISWLIYEMANQKMFTQRVGKNLVENLRNRQEESYLAGDDLYESLIETLQRGGATPEEAKSVFTDFMRGQGYDSFRITDLDPVNGVAIEATVIFNPAHVKHIDADTYDSDLPHMFADRISSMGDSSLSGKVMGDQIDIGRSMDHNDTVGVTAEAERIGVPNALQGFIRRTIRREEPTMDDFDAVQRHSGAGKGGNWIRENSIHLRRIGAHWFGNIVKPEGGAGIFQKQSSDLAQKVAPLIRELRELPDAGNAGTRWLQKNRGLAYPLSHKLGTPEPPASHQRIITALRLQDITTLNPEERILAMKIAAEFKSELAHMRELGIPVGDVASKMNAKFYVPQVWDIATIQLNPGKFNDVLVRHFMKEARKNGTNMDIGQANQTATDIINRMIDTDGRIDVDNVMHRRMSGSSNPFMQRFLHLGPEDVPEMAEYMVRDLEGILSRYFDKTTRVINMAKEFGVNNHGADAYIHVAQNGLRGAADLLKTGRTASTTRMETGVTTRYQDDVVPPLKMADDEIDNLVNRVAQALGDTKASKVANKQSGINLLLNAIDINTLDRGQYTEFKHRAKAIVNALSDFEDPASDDTIKWMQKYMDVLNRKPLGSDRAYSISRKIRTFNSVSLLSWTTLTSMPDVVLPLVRTGNAGAWAKGWAQRWMGDPSYKQAARDIGVGIENLIHDNMTHMAGDGSQRFTHAFFNATMLTPWTNMQREVSALVGFNALKAEADAARRAVSNGNGGGLRHRKAVRFLERYGLTEYGEAGGPRLDDIRTHTGDDKVRYAIMRFVNETIFTPDPNDVPMWAQTPWGSLIFQLKSFPIMMGRMSKDVIKEARHGNVAPLAMLLTAGSAFGMGANAAKDLIRGRGGESDNEHALRERRLHKTFVGDIAKAFGGDIESNKFMNEANSATLGFTPNQFLGWWVEGLMAMGGLGLIAEMSFNAAAQADNGSYGRERILSMALGPLHGTVSDVALKPLAAVMDIDDVGKRRAAFRGFASRLPVYGGIHSAREDLTTRVAGEAADRGKGGNKGGWIAKAFASGPLVGNTKQRRPKGFKGPLWKPVGQDRPGKQRPQWPMPGDKR